MAESAKKSNPIVDAARADAAEYTLWDSEVPGFGLRVRPSGAKSFVLVYRAGGRLRKLTVGQYPDLRLHDLRRHFASVGAARGLSLYQVGNLLGHTQAVTTQRYAHLQPDGLRPAANRIAGEIAADLPGNPPAKVATLTTKKGSR